MRTIYLFIAVAIISAQTSTKAYQTPKPHTVLDYYELLGTRNDCPRCTSWNLIGKYPRPMPGMMMMETHITFLDVYQWIAAGYADYDWFKVE